MYNLLIADDEAIIRRGIKTLIDYSNLEIDEIFEAENGEKAFELIKTQSIHIIFADINMPLMNGLDFAKKAKEIDNKIKIALITGYDYFEYVLSALKIGVDDYILKPVSKDDVTELLINLIEKRKISDGVESLKLSTDRILEMSNSNQDSLKQYLVDEINKNIENSEFTLSDLASNIGYNTSYLSTLFKKNFGLNFRDYILDIRLERAKILLLSTQMKSYEISLLIGIEDANYFSACFKRKFGVSTTDFRKNRGVK